MKTPSPWLRAGAVALLGLLFAVASAQAVLEARETAETLAGIERTHLTGCLRLHDHRFCVLSGRAAWSPAHVDARAVAASFGAGPASPHAEERPASRVALFSTQPRSPPVRS